MREGLALLLLIWFGWFILAPQKSGEYWRGKYDQFMVGWEKR